MDMEISFPGGLRVDARIGGLSIPTDQSRMAGGGGTAPAPYALFLASIGTCAGIYVLAFCRQRGIPTDGVRIIQRMHRERASGRLEQVDLEIQVPASFPQKYHKALIKSANQCAVKKVLEQPPRFETTVKVG